MQELRKFVAKGGGTVVELGSRDGHNAKDMASIFNARRVITIEANPDCHADIESSYPEFENYNLAISNKSGIIDFYKVGHEHGETLLGQSSLLYKSSYDKIATKIQVPALTMDAFVEKRGIGSIECMKIDVEGATYEVLEGFSKIRMTRLLHIESEHFEFWQGQKLYDDTAAFMAEAGYEQVYFAPVWTEQSDSVWLRKD